MKPGSDVGGDLEQGVERHNSRESKEISAARTAYGSSRRNSLSRRGGSASWRRSGSISDSQLPQDVEDVMVAQSGDVGDRVMEDEQLSCASTASLKFDNTDGSKEGVNAVHPLPEEDSLILVDGHWHTDSNVTDHVFPVSLLPSEMASVSAMYGSSHGEVEAQKQAMKEEERKIPKMLSYASCIAHLAVFGILGVFARYLLQKLFGPNVAAVTSDKSPLYPDLASNMVGSFLMGWMGIVYKDDLKSVSEYLAIGLTTGFLGSLTTFSAWMQAMLDLSVDGHWVFAAVELLIGVMLMVMSIFLGVDSAEGFRWVLSNNGHLNNVRCKINSWSKHTISFLVMLSLLAFLWALSGELFRLRLEANRTSAELWLACLVGPFGVWLRWRLARLNGQGLGRNSRFKWVPFGTLAANILAAAVMAALATIKLAVNTRRCELAVSGIQMGFLGCLSTVSTFAAEIYALRQSKHPWKAYVYAALTIVPSFILGTLIYSLPVWTKNYR